MHHVPQRNGANNHCDTQNNANHKKEQNTLKNKLIVAARRLYFLVGHIGWLRVVIQNT
jgi:hypothetical protein